IRRRAAAPRTLGWSTDAVPRRRPHFLDEPPDGARREHGAHSRCDFQPGAARYRQAARTEPARSPVDHRNRGGVPRTPRQARAPGTDRVHGARREEPLLDLQLPQVGARERARRALADHLRDVGDAQRHLARDARHSAQSRHRRRRHRVFRLGEGALASVPRRDLRHHRARRGIQLLAPRHFPRARRQHRAHPGREVPHPAALGGGRGRRARLLPVGGAAALGVGVRDLSPALPRPDLSDQGGASPDPRAAHAALACRLLRPGEGGDGAHPRPERRAGQAPRLRAACAALVRRRRRGVPGRAARISHHRAHRYRRARQPRPACLPGGGVNFSITHEFKYTYDSPVRLSTQYLRLMPRDTARQKVSGWRLETPGPALRTTDGYGNVLHVLTIDKPVSEISIEAAGSVETAPALDEPSEFTGAPLSPLLFLRPTGLTRVDEALASFAEKFRRAAGEHSGLRELAAAIRQRGGSAADAAHAFIACCRHLGVPARYVSGYVYAKKDQDNGVAMHAWAGAGGALRKLARGPALERGGAFGVPGKDPGRGDRGGSGGGVAGHQPFRFLPRPARREFPLPVRAVAAGGARPLSRAPAAHAALQG